MLDFPEHRLKLLQFQKIYRKTKKCLFTSIIIVGQKNIQYLHLFYLLPIIGFHPRIPGLLQISLLSAVCYKEIKIVNMIVFFARVFTALETVLIKYIISIFGACILIIPPFLQSINGVAWCKNEHCNMSVGKELPNSVFLFCRWTDIIV